MLVGLIANKKEIEKKYYQIFRIVKIIKLRKFKENQQNLLKTQLI